MKQLYLKEEEDELLRIRKNNLIIILSFACFIILSFVLMLVFSSYKTKIIFDIIASILITIPSLILVYFIAKAIHIKNLLYDFRYIKEEKGNTYKGKIIRVSSNLITLPDKLKAHEIEVSFDNGEGKVFYLSEMFNSEFILNENYKLVVVSDYIKGYEKDER